MTAIVMFHLDSSSAYVNLYQYSDKSFSLNLVNHMKLVWQYDLFPCRVHEKTCDKLGSRMRW